MSSPSLNAAALSLATVLAAGPADAQSPIRLRYATFDPVFGEPAVPEPLQNGAGDRLWIVQLAALPDEASRSALRAAGAELHGYLPDHAYVVRADADVAQRLAAQHEVRWVGPYHAAYRLEPELAAAVLAGHPAAIRCNVVLVDRHRDKLRLAADIEAAGGRVDDLQAGSLLVTATLSPAQLRAVARSDAALWIDRWGAPEVDVDNARIQGGADHLEGQRGYTGVGLNAHVYEGIDASHPAFTGPVINVQSSGASSAHGTSTAGIIFSNGIGNPQFRGIAPDVGKYYTHFQSALASRWQVVSDLVNVHDVSHTTAAWGGPRTTFYTSVSAATDGIIFDHDIAWTQSMGNSGIPEARPEAWAKNIFSVGGVFHFDNADPSDDTSGNGPSIGPAPDGRIKPTLVGYYDQVGTTVSGGGYTASFGGTSAATSIVAGFNILAIDAYTEEVVPGINPFGVALRAPGGSKHDNRPHFTTLKALQVASSHLYPFTATSTHNRRMDVGWGFCNLQTMWDARDRTFVVDETDVLTQGNTTRWNISVAAGEPELRVVMCYADPPGNPAAALHRINDLSLTVTAPNGTMFRGNHGLDAGNVSLAGGAADDVNPIEVVAVPNPLPGVWFVDVVATAVLQDSHVQTPQLDADYGLVVRGGTGPGVVAPLLGSFDAFGQGCAGTPGLPVLGTQGWPILGTGYSVTLTNALPTSGVLMMSGLTDALYNGMPLPAPLPNAPGCSVFVAPESNVFLITSAAGEASVTVSVPNAPTLLGVVLFHQWAALDAVNPLGLVVSAATKAVVGF